MPALRKIKSLKTNNLSMSDIAFTYLLSNLNLNEYVDSAVYMKNNKIIRLNATTGKYEILRSIVDNNTGTFNASKWILDSMEESVRTHEFINTIVVSGSNQPMGQTTQLWFDYVKDKPQIDPDTFS